jgi:hypothetical protein
MNEMEIVEISCNNDTLDIYCYNGNYFVYFDDENIYFHHFIVKNIVFNESIKILLNNYEEYLLNIVENENKMVFYNYLNGNEIVLNNIEIIKINNGIEILFYKKIKALVKGYKNTDEINNNINKKLNEIKIFLENELEKIKRKIEFYETENNNKELLNKNIGKKEIIINILDIVK